MCPGYERYWTAIQNEPDKPAWISGSAPTPAEIEWAVSPRAPRIMCYRVPGRAKPSDSHDCTGCEIARFDVQARAFPYSTSKRLHAFSA
jgi:hypothetical protein